MTHLVRHVAIQPIYVPVAANACPVPTKVHAEVMVEFVATPPADRLVATATSSRTVLTMAAIISLRLKEKEQARNQ
jgi:hypothetical protein